MMEPWLLRVAEEFWKTVGTRPAFPRDLEAVLPLGYPISCKALPGLSVGQVERWLKANGAPYRFLCNDRSLHGCVVAARGKGLVFTRAEDSAAEQRFTVAHEFAHFLLDYLKPRRQAEYAFGKAILEVLDGDRAPTAEERLSAVLEDMSLGVYFDLMPRAPDGQVERGFVMKAETQADRLALELLAPAKSARTQLGRMDGGLFERRAAALELLTDYYGLPERIARSYASALVRPRAESTAGWLGI